MEIKEFKEYTVDSGLYEAVRKLIYNNRLHIKKEKLVIFGSGKTGRMVAEILQRLDISIYGYLDNDVSKQDSVINTCRIYSPSILDGADDFQVIVGSVLKKIQMEITEQLEEKGYRKNKNFYLLEFNADASFIDVVKQPRSNHIQFFGCCFFSAIAMEDIGHSEKSLAQMFETNLGKENTKILALPGFSLREFYELLKMQIHMGNSPKRVVLIANMAQFMKRYQFLHDYSQHVELFEELKKELNIVDIEFEEFLRVKRSRAVNVQMRTEIKKTDANVSEQAAKQKFKLKYMGEIEIESEGYNYLEKISEYCEENEIKVLVVIAPVNYQYGQKIYGDKFGTYYSANVKLIQNTVGDMNMDFLDCSYLYSEENYPNPQQSDELGNYLGRKKIVEVILSKLREFELL